MGGEQFPVADNGKDEGMAADIAKQAKAVVTLEAELKTQADAQSKGLATNDDQLVLEENPKEPVTEPEPVKPTAGSYL